MAPPVKRRPGIAVIETSILQVLAKARCLELLLHAPLPVYVPLSCVLLGSCKFFPEARDAAAKRIAAFFDAHSERYVNKQTDSQSTARIRVVPESSSVFIQRDVERIRSIQDELKNMPTDPAADKFSNQIFLQEEMKMLERNIHAQDGYCGEYMVDDVAQDKNLTGPFYILMSQSRFWHTEPEELYQGREKYDYDDAIDNDFFPAPLEAFIGVLLQRGQLPRTLSNRLHAHFQTLSPTPR